MLYKQLKSQDTIKVKQYWYPSFVRSNLEYGTVIYRMERVLMDLVIVYVNTLDYIIQLYVTGCTIYYETPIDNSRYSNISIAIQHANSSVIDTISISTNQFSITMGRV